MREPVSTSGRPFVADRDCIRLPKKIGIHGVRSAVPADLVLAVWGAHELRSVAAHELRSVGIHPAFHQTTEAIPTDSAK